MRRFLAPEVVQTSAMDCGPASLKCLLEGFGIPVSYGRLREACQTDVDGTSIDTLEQVAVQLGLDAEQIMVPLDHLLVDEAKALPALVVVRQPNGLTHFVVAWRQALGMVQVMDPAVGRRWMSRQRFLDDVYQHGNRVPAADWREWAASEDFLVVLRGRLAAVGADAGLLVKAALADPSWRGLGALDAATRMVEALARAGGVERAQSARLVRALFDEARSGADSVPAAYWSVRAAPPDDGDVEQLILRGAVLLRVRGPRHAEVATPLPPELTAALAEPPSRPGRELWHLARADGLLTPSLLLGALAVASAAGLGEALLFRSLFDLGRALGVVEQRLAALGALLLFLVGLTALELPISAGLFGLGRRLEARLRLAFLAKLPRIGDRYFRSRPASDMADRSHSVHQVRQLPLLAGSLARAAMELVVTTVGIAWLDRRAAPPAVIAAALAVVVPLALQPPVTERDLRVRFHSGSLARFYLDAMLGLVAVRTHVAERAVRREHESLLVEWARASRGLVRAVVLVEGVQALIGFVLAAWLLRGYLDRAPEAGGMLLLVYWALNLPVVGREIALLARQVPLHRNVTLRLVEPLGALEEAPPVEARPLEARAAAAGGASAGVALRFEGVGVVASGHPILDGVDLEIAPGAQVAVVGPSGAGKSSLVGLCLGWHRPSAGRLLVDGRPLDGEQLAELRRATAWVDPEVQLWNRSLLANLQYGARDEAIDVGPLLAEADLRGVLESLPEGLQTRLGEGGALVSGGEGQRVRLGRALGRKDARLVILDEPFRGLDREQRRALLVRARAWWERATLLFVTHDVGETLAFSRVLVIDGGRLVEDGAPSELLAREGSRYRALVEAERAVRSGLWGARAWRRLRVEGGRVTEEGA